jgi:hypothetical protein
MPTRRIDRRSRPSRRFQELVSALSLEISDEPMTAAQDALVQQCAALMLRAETLRDQILLGESVPDQDLVRISNSVGRLVAALRTEARKKTTPPTSLAAYLKETAQQQ